MKPTQIFLIAALAITIACETGYAGSATWASTQHSNNWNTAANWTPQTVPNGPDDIASFATSLTKSVSVAANIEISSLKFSSGADAFAITAQAPFTLNISGVGVTNDSGTTQNFVTASGTQSYEFGSIQFDGGATAGSQVTYSNNSGTNYGGGGYMAFTENSTAGNATFINHGSTTDAAGRIEFYDSSTAGNGVFTNQSGDLYGGVVAFFENSNAGHGIFTNTGRGDDGGIVSFADNSTAANATITANGAPVGGTFSSGVYFSDASTAGSATLILNGNDGNGFGGAANFYDSSTAANATIICNGGPGYVEGGYVAFYHSATGGSARIELIGRGSLYLSSFERELPEVSIGSLEGDGFVYLYGSELIVGSNDLDTTFSGIISDGDPYFGVGGKLTKVGDGQLTLTNANDYPGGTIVYGGTLMVNNTGASGTGSGSVQVNSGTLAGSGIIAGAVTIGTGGFLREAFLTPGREGPGVLVIQNTLTFKSDATHKWKYRTKSGEYSQVMANGVTIESGATSIGGHVGGGALAVGTVLTIINNTASTPIAGRFEGLRDGARVTRGVNNFRVNYEGGDGNDLTLTVVL